MKKYGVSNRRWDFCHVSPCYIPGLPLEFIDLNIKDNMTPHKLVFRWYLLIPMQDVKCYSDVLRFLQNIFCPIGITILLVYAICIIHCFGNYDTKLVRSFVLLGIVGINNTGTLLDSFGHPPCKFRLIVQFP